MKDRVLDLCCGSKKCPVLRESGGIVTIEDGPARIELDREQAARVAHWLLVGLSEQKSAQVDLHDASPGGL